MTFSARAAAGNECREQDRQATRGSELVPVGKAFAMRFPSINLRWDKLPAGSERLETLEWMLVGNAAR